MTVATSELDALVRREHTEPHAVLGAHPANGGVVVRALRPAALKVSVKPSKGKSVALKQIHPGGVFEGMIEGAEMPLHYQLKVDYGDGGKFKIQDPYAFTPTLGELDLHLIAEGRHEELYDKLGAHVRKHQGVEGTAFAVWAPAARAVSVVGDFNSWDGRLHAMRSLGSSGIWELFLPGVGAGARYKYEILTADGELVLKADPLAQETEVPPRTASIVVDPQHRWSQADAALLGRSGASSSPLTRPVSIYEVHLGSWRLNSLEDNRPLTYTELADELSAYVTDMGFTHVELLPVMAHPFTRLVGLPGHRLLRAHAALRLARRLPRVRRPHARSRRRGDPRLGPGPLPARRVRAGPLRRQRAVRARRSAARRPPGLGDAGVQLRAPRGPQLPHLQRPVLAARVPRRRDPGRRRRLDAVPRLLAPRRASGCPTSSAAARTWRRSSSSRSSTR